MTTQLSLWQELLLLGLAALSIIYILYFRIWLALAIGSDVLFAAALGLALAAIAAPDLFHSASASLVDRSPLPAALQNADARVAAIEALPRSLIERALAQIGYELDEVDEPPDPPEPGPFVSAVRPSVEALVSTVLRFASFVCGSFLMLTSLAMRSSTMTVRKLQQCTQRIDDLESALASIQSAPEVGLGQNRLT
jgi:hypothetical protein